MNNELSITAILASCALAVGCSSSGMANAPENGGAAATGSRAATQPRPCTPSSTTKAPADGLVTDFSGSGAGVPGKVASYFLPERIPPSALTSRTSGGSLEIAVNAQPTDRPRFLGTVFEFDGCIDARAFAGVQFTVTGAFSGCSLTAAVGDVGHDDVANPSRFATGNAGSYPPQTKVLSGGSAPRTIKLPFARSDIEGSPGAPTDAGALTSTLWQFIVPVAPTDGTPSDPCTGRIAISDVKLYR